MSPDQVSTILRQLDAGWPNQLSTYRPGEPELWRSTLRDQDYDLAQSCLAAIVREGARFRPDVPEWCERYRAVGARERATASVYTPDAMTDEEWERARAARDRVMAEREWQKVGAWAATP